MPDAKELLERGLRFERGGVLDEALRCYDAVATMSSTDTLQRVEALRRKADVHRTRCEWDESIAAARLSRQAAEADGLEDAVAEALNAEAAVYHSRGDLASAAGLYERVLDHATSPRVRGIALQNLGGVAAMEERFADAVLRFQESLACFRAVGYERGVAIALSNLGRAALDQGDDERARSALREALSAARAVDDLDLTALAAVNLAEALLRLGDCEQAEEHGSAALGFFKISGNIWRQIEALRLMGDVRRQLGDMDVARRLYAQALELAEKIGAEAELPRIRSRLETLEAQ